MGALDLSVLAECLQRKYDKTCLARTARVSNLSPIWTKAAEVVQVCQGVGEMPQRPVSFHSAQP